MKLGEKLRAIRRSEGLTQVKFCEISGIALGTLKNYEGGHQEPGMQVVLQVTNSPQLEKYTLWLMTNKTNPEAGQIAPSLSGNQASKVKSDGAAKNAEEVVTQISSQQPDMKAIISSLSNLDDDELKQLSKQLSRQGIMSFLDFLDPENQSLVNLEGKKRRAALRLESMGEKQLREILSKIELSDESFKEDVNNPIKNVS